MTAPDARAGWPADLAAMFAELDRADPLYRPSRYWEELNVEHIRTLITPEGYARFKRTLNDSYFQFGFYAFPRALAGLVWRWTRRRDCSVLGARFERPTRAKYHALLAPALALYAEAVASLPGGELLRALNEPSVGDPLVVRYGRWRTTQDLCHSVEELCAVRSALPAPAPRTVAELGAGYGRLAFAWLSTDPAVSYYVIDIPPALFLAQRYLTEVLAGVPTFRFRPFARFADVAAELLAARLVFLEPHQLTLLPDRHFDLMLTISTLPEMRRDQVQNYLRLVDLKSARAFYLKQWRRWRNPVDDVETAMEDYRLPPSWTLRFRRPPLLPREFFEALYVRDGR